MTLHLAVWEGQEPATDDEAARTFEELYARYIDTGDKTPPTEPITAYVRRLLARYPDLTELDDDAVDDSPWADGPMINDASGPFIYFSLVTNKAAEEAWLYAVDVARSMKLVTFDPQSSALAT
jgi:hypothetical protein